MYSYWSINLSCAFITLTIRCRYFFNLQSVIAVITVWQNWISLQEQSHLNITIVCQWPVIKQTYNINILVCCKFKSCLQHNISRAFKTFKFLQLQVSLFLNICLKVSGNIISNWTATQLCAFHLHTNAIIYSNPLWFAA